MTSTTPWFVGVFNNPSPINCLHNHTTNIGHGAGTQISANNIGPGTVGCNNNGGPGAGGFNSGDYSGAINSYRNCEGNRVGALVLPGGGSRQRVRRGRFDHGEYFSPKSTGGYYENRLRESFNRERVSSIHIPERKCRCGNRFGGGGRMWIPKQHRHVTVERDKTKIIEFKTKKEEKAWLDFCAVGCLREHKDILPTVNKNLREQGFTFCKATHMGDDRVLLQCPNNNDLSSLIDKGRVLLKCHFQWVKPWSPKIGDERYVYLRFEGVPLHAWTESFFRIVVDLMRGRFISMDDSTVNKRRLDVARVLIRTTSNEIISESFTVRIDSNDYNVKVIEETDQNSAAVDSNWDISDNDSAVVDRRFDVEQSDGDSSDKEFQEIVGREEEIFTGNSRSEFCGNTECYFQTAQQKCSGEPSQKNQNELGSQNVVPRNTLNAGAKPFSPKKKLNAKAKPFGPANLSFPLICNGKEVSDKDSAVVNGRLEGELSDRGLCKGDEKERREEKIFSGNRKSEFIQTAQETYSLGSKQDGCREEDGEIGSSDKGSQQIVKSWPQKGHPGGSGSKNCGSDTSRTIGNGDKDGAASREPMVKRDAIAARLQIPKS